MVSRVWHCYTTPENADAFETLLRTEILVGIKNRNIIGYNGVQLFRRVLGNEIEFLTVMWFDSLDAVRNFAGENYEAAIVPAKVKTLLTGFDSGSQHYDVAIDMKT